MARDQELAAPAVPILLKDLIEPEQKTGMDGADFGMAERIGPRIEVAAPILECGRTAENENIATIDDLDSPAYLVAIVPVVETVPRDRWGARILVNADAEIGDILVGNPHNFLPSRPTIPHRLGVLPGFRAEKCEAFHTFLPFIEVS